MTESLHNLYFNISQSMPERSFLMAGENFLYSAAINTLLFGSPGLGVVYGVVAFAVSFFDSLSGALIKLVFEVDSLSWYMQYTKKIVLLGSVQLPLFYLGINISIVSSIAIYVLLELYKGEIFSEKSLSQSSFVFISSNFLF